MAALPHHSVPAYRHARPARAAPSLRSQPARHARTKKWARAGGAAPIVFTGELITLANSCITGELMFTRELVFTGDVMLRLPTDDRRATVHNG